MLKSHTRLHLTMLALALAACAAPPPPPGAPATLPNVTAVTAPGVIAPTSAPNTVPTNAPAVGPTTVASPANTVDLTRLPLGDGRLATGPTVGWIWPCRTDPEAGGAFVDGPWIKDDGTYDFTAKAVVDGAVTWPSSFSMSVQGDRRVFTSNDLPNHATGHYPIAQNDDAYNYDRNPNAIAAQNFQFDLPANPALASQPSCAPGAVGILLSGSILFNALDAPGRDAVAHETQDGCQGHPQSSGVYHYHNLTTCLTDSAGDGHSALMGYILDGFGLYGHHGEGGVTLTSTDLDECHGHTHPIDWDEQQVVMYHYHATWDFPYTVGCMRGAVDTRTMQAISGEDGGQSGQSGQGQPTGQSDLASAAAKLGLTEQQLRDALGPPPPDFAAAAAKLGVSEQALREALGIP